VAATTAVAVLALQVLIVQQCIDLCTYCGRTAAQDWWWPGLVAVLPVDVCVVSAVIGTGQRAAAVWMHRAVRKTTPASVCYVQPSAGGCTASCGLCIGLCRFVVACHDGSCHCALILPQGSSSFV
jgi:hypothetical protein